jgi:uncharacterized membrane protein
LAILLASGAVTLYNKKIMENAPSGRRAGLRWEWLVILACGVLLVTWLYFTPSGLLGKADAIGYAVCHRIDSHSFNINGRNFPVCARCSGMYLGAVLGLVYQSIRGRRGGMPSFKIFVVLGIFLIAFGIDGVNSYLHFFPNAPSLYQPQNWLRLVTGTGVGLGLAAVVLPAFHQTLWSNWNENRALGSWRQLGGLLLLAALLDGLVLTDNPVVLYPLALISAAGVVTLLTMVYCMVVVMLFKRENGYISSRQIWLPLLAGFIIAMLQIAVLDWGRFALTGTWTGFKF